MSITIDKDGVCNQDELTFQVNDFRQPKVLTNYYQVAKRLQNLVLMKKGTMPNDYDMGLDINSYRFEYRNDKTQNLIKSDLQVQIDKYLPDIPVSNFEILFKTMDDYVTVYIGFSFTDYSGSKSVILSFDMSSTNNNKSQIVSEIYIV